MCTLYLHTSTTRSLISQARNNIWPCAIARVAVKIAIPRGIVSRCINDPLHHLRPRSIRRRPPLPATPVPFVCRLSREIGARSPFGNAPRIRLSSEERDNYRDKRNVDRSLWSTPREKIGRSRVRTRWNLPLSFTRWSRVVDLLQMRNLSSIWIEAMATSVPDSPLCGPVWSVGPSLSAPLENGCFGFSWMRRVTPSSAALRAFSIYFFLTPSSPLTSFIELFCHCLFRPRSRSSDPFSFSQLDRLTTSSRECETIVHRSRLERAGHLDWVNILPPFSPALGIAFSKATRSDLSESRMQVFKIYG